jgi:flagella basal body P-ring formation protein FlgA
VVDGRPAARFLATAAVDDWQEVPVITRELQRGTVIGAGDVQMVRLNLSQYSGEIIRDLSEAVGQRAKGRIGAGEVIRRSLVDLPPTIVRGAKVKAIYKKGALTAVLNSVAVEDGFLGEEMRIKNESSKKVLTGRVLSGEEVEVTE